MNIVREHFTQDGQTKHAFPTKAEAVDAAARQQARNGSNRRPYRAYKCKHCLKFHIGKRAAKGKKKRHALPFGEAAQIHVGQASQDR